MEINRIDHPKGVILLVDRDPLMLTAMASVLNMQGHRAFMARAEEIAMQTLSAQPIDLIILAIEELEAGCQFAARLRSGEKNQDIPVIFLVPTLTPQWVAQLQTQGGVYCLLQPVDPHDLIELVERALWLPHIATLKIGKPNMLSSEASPEWIKL